MVWLILEDNHHNNFGWRFKCVYLTQFRNVMLWFLICWITVKFVTCMRWWLITNMYLVLTQKKDTFSLLKGHLPLPKPNPYLKTSRISATSFFDFDGIGFFCFVEKCLVLREILFSCKRALFLKKRSSYAFEIKKVPLFDKMPLLFL